MQQLNHATHERSRFLSWLETAHPALHPFAANVDPALIKGRKMTISNRGGISFVRRQMLINVLKEYYQLQQPTLHAIEQYGGNSSTEIVALLS